MVPQNTWKASSNPTGSELAVSMAVEVNIIDVRTYTQANVVPQLGLQPSLTWSQPLGGIQNHGNPMIEPDTNTSTLSSGISVQNKLLDIVKLLSNN